MDDVVEDLSMGWRREIGSLVVWFVLSLVDHHVRLDVTDRLMKMDLDLVERSLNVVR